MAQYRQSGTERFTVRNHDFHGSAAEQIGVRIPHKHSRIRRPGRSDKIHRRISVSTVAVILSLGLLASLFAFHHLSQFKETRRRLDGQGNDAESGFRPFRVLGFGQGSVGIGRDSRYWDRDDRIRDGNYDASEHVSGSNFENLKNESGGNVKFPPVEKGGSKGGSGGLYNEGGRAELDSYKEEYETSLKNGGKSKEGNGVEEVNPNDEYDDGIDSQDLDQGNGGGGEIGNLGADDDGESGKDAFNNKPKKDFSVVSQNSGTDRKTASERVSGHSPKISSSRKKPSSKRKPKKVSGSSCEMKFMNSTAQLVEPFENKKFSRFSLKYTKVEDMVSSSEKWEPRFAGHQSLQEREESYYARDQKINCGFIKGPKGSPSTGFDLAEDDLRFMSSCHIAVSSCIFGNSDKLRIPYSKTVTRLSRKSVCFIMFVDETTLQTLLSEGNELDSMGFIGLWKIVVVKNLPYTDMRRVGKIPKFLAHRLFTSARYSIWLDSKLRLQSDPLLILEYFLWRRGYEYAISNHYDRHCVWEEVMQNKKLNKFNHSIIDEQFEFYQADGLIRFNPADPNRLLPSYVPEGSFIVRAHTPMSNLFSCLWFNEVDRFTPRDQLSFAYTYLKLRRMNPGKPFHLNMFKDCERRSIAKLFHHRAEEKRNAPAQAVR